ncbi:MAG: penicillin-binding protein 1A, partial [Myxococcota bacterium]
VIVMDGDATTGGPRLKTMTVNGQSARTDSVQRPPPPSPGGAQPPVFLGRRSLRGFLGALRVSAFLVSLGLLGGALGGFLLLRIASGDLPPIVTVADYRPKLATRVYSVDGRLIGEFGNERRVLVPYDRIPKRLLQAFIAAEDKNFFDHGGIDYLGNLRAILFRVVGKTSRIGGTSTITQQLAKSLLIEHMGFEAATERSIGRKVKEAVLARRLEAALTKEEILYLYLNQVFLGHGAYGVQAAAEHYFRKDVFELSLPEVALIAGLPQAPSRYSPLVNAKAAQQRVGTVLRRMHDNGFISRAQMEEALSINLVEIVHPRDDRFRDTAPYFTEHVRRHLYDTYGEKALYEGGLRVYTTLDLERQGHAETALTEGIRTVDKRQGWRGPVANVPKRDWDRATKLLAKHNGTDPSSSEGLPLLALVTRVDRKRQWADVSVGESAGVIPLAGMRWAREPNPNVYWESHLVTDVGDVLHEGDVVLVTRATDKELREMAMGQAIAKQLPTREDVTLYALDQVPYVEGALIAMNPHSGYVESMIGGYAFEGSEFNRAFQACRQPGSAMKPIVYSAAIVREGLTPATMVLDTPITVRDADIGKSWKPQNFELNYKGEVTMREALMNSMNIPALHTMQRVGVKEVLAWAKRLGIRTELKEELGTAIGSSCVTPWELTNAYTTFARGGLRPEPVFIKRVIDRDGNVLEAHAGPNDPWQSNREQIDSLYRQLLQPPMRVMDAQDAFLTNYLLTQVATQGTAARASSLNKPVAGKTGTTNDSFDTWFVGYTPSLVTSVWVGYDTYAMPLAAREQGGRTSLPIWLEFMGNALRGKDEPPFEEPADICYARVDGRTGSRVFEAIPGSFIAPFRCGTEPETAVAAGFSLEDAVKRGGL